MKIKANISIGELVDKITILEIKSLKIENKDKLKNVKYELEILNKIFNKLDTTEDVKQFDATALTEPPEVPAVSPKIPPTTE